MEGMLRNRVESFAEKEGNVLAYVTFSRHGETKYTDQYPDITKKAELNAREKGKIITAEKGSPDIIIYSPAVRAKGTADAISAGSVEGHTHPSVQMRESHQIRPSEFSNRQRAEELFLSIGDQEEIARQHHIEGGAFTDPNILETPESKRARLYRGLEYLIRSLDRSKKAPHVVIVSHYELISILITDIFGDLDKSFGRYNIPSFGEHVDVELIRTDDPGIVTVKINCDNKVAARDFDRKKRLFI
ncbi:MAG: phosphoglycerate mutase family protein [Candidatus Moranbacteria bacterium]|nr:phosphoglycerate mutase family protein [Candidatus Moranbacteria bacterium]